MGGTVAWGVCECSGKTLSLCNFFCLFVSLVFRTGCDWDIPVAIASRLMEISWNGSEHIWPPRPECSCHSLLACVLQWGLARHSPSPRGKHIGWERKEMCCAPAGLLVWITGIATESGKNICPATKTHGLWYTDEKLWNDESKFSGKTQHWHCHKHGSRCIIPQAGVALLWKYWLRGLLLLCGNHMRSGSPTAVQVFAFWGEMGFWKPWQKYWRSLG